MSRVGLAWLELPKGRNMGFTALPICGARREDSKLSAAKYKKWSQMLYYKLEFKSTHLQSSGDKEKIKFPE